MKRNGKITKDPKIKGEHRMKRNPENIQTAYSERYDVRTKIEELIHEI